MDEKKQIEEMLKCICMDCRYFTRCNDDTMYNDRSLDEALKEKCSIWKHGKALYNAGYRKQSEWISVDERLPDIELHKAKAVVPDVLFPCLVVREGNIVSYIEKAWYWGAKFTTQDCTDITDSITHWMPLPEAPKMKGGAE